MRFTFVMIVVLLLYVVNSIVVVQPAAGIHSGIRPLHAHLNRFWDSRLTQTDLMEQAADSLKIAPPWNAPRWLWSFAWKLQKHMMPILHFFDRCAPKDTHLNLAVLWWKSMAGNRRGTATDDGGVAYDLLPPYSRNIVAFPFCYLYPPLHHQTVAMRTAFLDSTLDEVCRQEANNKETIRVITLGAGFDTRSLRYSQQQQNDDNPTSTTSKSKTEFYEIDLPEVVVQKSSIFERFKQRRRNTVVTLPRLYGADLNDIDRVKGQLELILKPSSSRTRRPTVIMVEAVLMYLKSENIMPLLSTVMTEVKQHSSKVYFIFADRLPSMPYNDVDPTVERIAATELLRSIGLQLEAYQGKPGMLLSMCMS